MCRGVATRPGSPVDTPLGVLRFASLASQLRTAKTTDAAGLPPGAKRSKGATV